MLVMLMLLVWNVIASEQKSARALEHLRRPTNAQGCKTKSEAVELQGVKKIDKKRFEQCRDGNTTAMSRANQPIVSASSKHVIW